MSSKSNILKICLGIFFCLILFKILSTTRVDFHQGSNENQFSDLLTFKKVVLVSGGAGFVGSNLVKRLIRNESTLVIIVDNFSSGSVENLRPILHAKNLRIFRNDVRSSPFAACHEIYHLSSYAAPDLYMKNPITTIDTNFNGAKRLLDLAHKYNARILFSSSSEVYGSPTENPQNESYWGYVNPVGTRSSYDEAKRATEALFVAYQTQKKVAIRIVRIFNTFGPGMLENDGRLISSTITKAIRNEPIKIFGNGTQTRSNMYIDDLIDGMILAMKSDYDKPINLGNPEELSVNEVVNMIINYTNSSSKIIHGHKRADDPWIRRPDISLAKKVLGWEPRVSFKRGLVKTIDYFISLRDKSNSTTERLIIF